MESKGTEFEELKKLLKPVVDFVEEFTDFKSEVWALLGELAKQIQGHLALIQEYRKEVVTRQESTAQVVGAFTESTAKVVGEFTDFVRALLNKLDGLSQEQQSILQQLDLLVKGSARLHQVTSQLATAMVLQAQNVSSLAVWAQSVSQAMSDLSTPWLVRWLKKKLHV